MMDETTTRKVAGVTKEDEKQYAQRKYDEALKTMLEDPTMENITSFAAANALLFTVEDAYRIGARLLLERSRLMDILSRRNYTSYNETKHIQLRR